jgi:hypothetical protein
LAIEGDGSVVYEGKRNVSAVGTRKGQIKPAVVRDLAQKFREIGYFDFARNYGSCKDGAVVVTSGTLDGKSNEVVDEGCGVGPPEFHQLEDEIDRITNSKVWIRGRTRLWLHKPWHHS